MGALAKLAQGFDRLFTSARSGGIASVESNVKLQGDKGFGSLTTLGQWELMIQTDAVVSAGWRATLGMLTAVDFDIDAHVEADPRVVEYLRRCLFETPKRQMIEYASQIFEAMIYGFAPQEIILMVGDDGLVYLRDLAPRPARTIDQYTVEVTPSGWVKATQQVYGTNGTLNKAEFDEPGKGKGWLLWTIWGDARQPFGQSLMRPVWFLFDSKREALLGLRIATERNTVGTLYFQGKDDVKIDSEDKDNTLDELEKLRLHEKGTLYVPPWVEKLDFLSDSGSCQDKILATLQYYDAAMLQCFQHQWMALGLNGEGSRALGEVSERQSKISTMSHLGWLSRQMQPLIDFLVEYNFGPQKHYPQLAVTYKQEPDINVAVQSIVAALNARAITPDFELENHIRRMLQLPEKIEEEEVQPEPPTQENPDALRQKEEIEDEEKIDEQGEQPGEGESNADIPEAGAEKLTACSCGHTHFAESTPGLRLPPQSGGQKQRTGPNDRPLGVTERLVQWDRIEMTLDQSQETLRSVARKVRSDYMNAMLDQADYADVPALVASLRKVTISGALRSDANKALRSALETLIDLGYETVASELKVNAEFSAVSGGVGAATYADTVAAQLSESLEGEARATLVRMGLTITAQSPAEIKSILERATSEQITRNLRSDEDITLASTEVFARAREEYVDKLVESEGKDPPLVYYSAVLDDATCEFCKQADDAHNENSGTPIVFGSDEHKQFLPPYYKCLGGGRCRCILIFAWGNE